ncbi:hypothetical protein ACMYR3_06825 [Ampullimonas aquatilis]|uniref:hypothetical protein n=1 Tax=Ampullimonas aquatilis TaxID=1341549 RepID=UPI003C721D20
MKLTWTKLGFLGFMIPLAFWGIAAVGWGSSNFSAFRVAFVLAAVAVYVVGTKLNAEAQEQGDDAPHQSMGYPMQWSGLGFSAAGFVLTLL